MRITCPQCHSRCRLKTDKSISDSSQGKCPECGHIFPIPPGVNREDPTTDNRSAKQKKAGFVPGFKLPEIISFPKLLRSSGKTSLFWFFSGLCLIILLTVIFVGSRKTPPPRPEQSAASKSSPVAAKPPARLSLPPHAKAKAIALIKHHALVGDADINISDNQLQLALMVSGNTPVTYAERLGRQFAHYLKEQLADVKQASRETPIRISVYYPGGTRITVTTNDQSGEEEVLPKSPRYQ